MGGGGGGGGGRDKVHIMSIPFNFKLSLLPKKSPAWPHDITLYDVACFILSGQVSLHLNPPVHNFDKHCIG